MALADLMASFRSGDSGANNNQQQPMQQPAQTNPGQIPANASTGNPGSNTSAPNGLVPNGAENNTGEKSPLDTYDKLWEDDPNAKNEPDLGVLGEIDPAKIQEVAGKFNFMQNIPKEDIELIKAGGEGAMQAMARAVNRSSQNVFAQSAVATSKLIEQALAKQAEKFEAKLPSLIKQQTFSNSLREENPAYSHPAAAPIVSMIEDRLSQKYPNATTAELKTMAQDFFSTTFSAISGADKKKTDDASAAKTGINWEEELGITSIFN